MPDQNQQQSQGDGKSQGTQQQQQGQPVKFDEWIKGQPAEIVAAYEQHTGGLRNALSTERTQRGDLEKQLREMAGKVEKGSDAEKRLTDMANQLSAAEARQDFYDQAVKVGVSDLKLAYIVAREEGLIDSKGRVNFDELKKSHPTLFGAAPGPGRVDGGAGGQPPPMGGMNALLKQALER